MLHLDALRDQLRLTKFETITLSILFFLAIFIRVTYIWDNNIHFYFDQSRDAYESQLIYKAGDLKIQGPSASGTKDTIYHGVLYYYIIGFFYFIGNGHPLIPNLALITLASSAILPLYVLTKSISGSRFVGGVAVWLFVFSADLTIFSTALANTTLLIALFAWFYFFCWQVFFNKSKQYLPLIALSIGLCHQSAIFTIYLVCNLIIFYLYKAIQDKRLILFDIKTLLLSILIYLITVSTLILTQFKLWRAGIFEPFQMGADLASRRPIDTILNDIWKYLDKVSGEALLPINEQTSTAMVILILLISVFLVFKKRALLIPLIWFLGPIWLIILTAKGSYHISVGSMAGLYVLCAYLLYQCKQYAIGRLIILIVLGVFTFNNFNQIIEYQHNRSDPLAVQSKGMLNQQLQLVDLTYQLSQDSPFSISTLTGPHGVNTTWSYLYHWYGNKKYGYTPSWFGPDQTGIHAGEYLTMVTHPELVHFVIYEPNPGSNHQIRLDFKELQTIYAGEPIEIYSFDELVLEQRSGIDAKKSSQ